MKGADAALLRIFTNHEQSQPHNGKQEGFWVVVFNVESGNYKFVGVERAGEGASRRFATSRDGQKR